MATAVLAATVLSAVGVVSGVAPVSAELRLPAAPSWVTNTAKNLRVRALARLGNTLYVGGEFTQIMPMPGGPVVAQPYLFAVDATTGAWRWAFAPAITAPAGTELDPSGVLALETDPSTGSVFVGGKFNTVNGQAVTGFAVLDAATGAFKSGVVQKPATRSGSAVAVVDVLHRVGTKLYVGGLFERLGGLDRGRVARLELTSAGFGIDGWTASVQGGEVLAFADDPAVPGRIYLGGKFTSAGPSNDPRGAFLVAFDTGAANSLLPWFPQPDGGDKPGWVLGLDAVNGRVYAGIAGGGGQFNVYSGTVGAPKLLLHQFRATGNIQAVNVVGNTVFVGGHNDDFRDPVIPQAKLNAFDATTLATVPLPVDVNGAWGVFAIEGDVPSDMWFGGQIASASTGGAGQSQGNLLHLREGQVADNQAPPAPARPVVANGLFTNIDVAWPPAADNGVILAYYLYVNGTLARVVPGGDNGATLAGLPSGTPQQIAVLRALDGGRNLSAPSPVATITTGAAAPTLPNPLNGYGQYYPVNPSRILDTRSGLGAESAAPLQGGVPKTVRVAGLGGVAATGAQSVALNVTVTEPTGSGFLTVYPGGENSPATSNLNFTAGQTVPNLVIARVGADGSVKVRVNAGTPHVVADVVGWFGSAQTPAAGGSRITPQAPQRVLDTRAQSRIGPWGKVGQGQEIDVAVAPPGSGVTGVVLNLTGTEPTSSTYVTAFPADAPRPTASNLNLVAGETRANLVIVRVPADGRIKLFNLAGATHLVADVVATFAPAADTTAAGRLLPLAAPLRLLDTRGGPPLAGPGVRTTSFAALDAATPGNLRGLVLNLTATEPTSSTYLTAYPADSGVPLASNVNVTRGQSIPNLAVAMLSSSDELSVFNLAGSVHYLFDVAALVLG